MPSCSFVRWTTLLVLSATVGLNGCGGGGSNRGDARVATDAPASLGDGGLSDTALDAIDDGWPPEVDAGSVGTVPNVVRNRARLFVSGQEQLAEPLGEQVAALAAGRGDDFDFNEQILRFSYLRLRTKGDDVLAAGWPGYQRGDNHERLTPDQPLDVVAELRAPKTLAPGELYDTLVVAESTDAIQAIQWENTVGYARHYMDRLHEGNPEGFAYLLQPWLQGPNKDDPHAFVDYEKRALVAWECTATKVNLTLARDGRADRIAPLPAGLAMAVLVERVRDGQVRGLAAGPLRPRLDALFAEGGTLTELGRSYFAAVLYAAVFRKTPVGTPAPAGLDGDTVADLRGIAWEVVGGYYAQATPGERAMDDCRTQMVSNVCPAFYAIAGGATAARDLQLCLDTFGDRKHPQNPFRWPDPKLLLYPAP